MAMGIVAVAVWAGAARARAPPAVRDAHRPPRHRRCGGVADQRLAARSGAQAVLQEFFLLAWCGAVTSLCRSDRVLRAVVRTWCLSSIVLGRLHGRARCWPARMISPGSTGPTEAGRS